MKPEDRARAVIDKKLVEAGWIIQDMDSMYLPAGLGVAVREFPTDTGPVDYALFIAEEPVGVIEAKKSEVGEDITVVEEQSLRYANSKFKYKTGEYRIRFAYEATDKRTRFTDYADKNYRARDVYTFMRPESMKRLLDSKDTIRNYLKLAPKFEDREDRFRACQVAAITNLDKSMAENRPRALIQMATGAGKTFTAITSVYRMLKHGHMRRVLFLVDTKNLGIQAEGEFRAYIPSDDNRPFGEIYSVCRLSSSFIPESAQVCISTIQRMFSILRGEELDEGTEESSFFEDPNADKKEPKQVVYNAQYPPEFFDMIIVDECHRSIYNIWSQIFEYFDAFVVGLTATPDKRTFGFFKENVVSEYTREQAIIDNVNVPEEIFVIETDITKNGATIRPQLMEFRDRQSRQKRWEEVDEELEYGASQLDRDVVNPSQMRTVIRCFRENLAAMFPGRDEVPKTLIFAKTDSHADDIVGIVREEFGEGNQFCKKITYRAADSEKAESLLNSFRNDYYPRVAVTVNMIATGTDVKPLECLIFMRDVKSKNYFEQMLGRGTRVLSAEQLKQVTPSAKGNKDHFVLVDAVGVTKSIKTETRNLIRKPTIPLAVLMKDVAMGTKDEATLQTIAGRLVRLSSQMTDKEKKAFSKATGGIPINIVTGRLLDAFDPDKLVEETARRTGTDAPTDEQIAETQEALISDAVAPFKDPKVRTFIEDVRRSHDQILDNTNMDAVLFAGFDGEQKIDADEVIASFREFIEQNKDEIIAFGVIYDITYKERPMTLDKLRALYAKLTHHGLSIEKLDGAYVIKHQRQKGTFTQIVDLVALIRYEMGLTTELLPFADRVRRNFKDWMFRKNASGAKFTEEQTKWLQHIRDHIITSMSLVKDDFELDPFDSLGGLGKFYQLFGADYEDLIYELDRELVA